jgi:serine/threonine protein phosphatase PrpC
MPRSKKQKSFTGTEKSMKYATSYRNGRGRNPPSTEDRHFVDPGEITILGVLDGHGGLAVVEHTHKHLSGKIRAHVVKSEGDENTICKGLAKLFHEHNEGLKAGGRIIHRDTGSTATIAIITAKSCIIAHIGDSPACIFDPEGKVLHTIRPHVPSNAEEKHRIEKNGGFVSNSKGDIPRVMGELAVSRAFGDFSLAPHVICEPDIQVFPRPERGYLALMSDGLIELPPTIDNDDKGEIFKSIPDIAKNIAGAIQETRGDLPGAAELVLKRHVNESSGNEEDYNGDDLTLIIHDIGLGTKKPFNTSITRHKKGGGRRRGRTKKISGTFYI